MGSTNISEITEIKNSSSDTYFMYVWDDEHEGRYSSFTGGEWHYPDEGRWLRIGPGDHLRADDAGIPDGGKTAGKDRTRVIFKAASPGQRPSKGDPDRGLRVNRVGVGGGRDALNFTDNSSGELLSAIEVPTRMHQSLRLIIDDKGARFQQTDIAVSGEAQLKEAGEAIGEAFEKLAEIFLEVIKRIPEA